MRKILILLLLASPAWAATYFVSSGGADTNNGTTKATPWLHAPGMSTCTNVCASTVLSAGDKVVFRGGDTWHLDATSPSVGTFTITASGTSGNPVTYGVDPTFFLGGSWTRPIFSGDNPLSTTFVASCSHAQTGTQVSIGSGSSSNVTIDNWEFTGVCWNTNTSSNGTMLSIPGGDTNIVISNLYCHGWTMTSGASDNFPCITSFGGGTVADNNQFTFDVFDGSDSPHYAAGSVISGSLPACQWSATGNSPITNVAETSGNVVTISTSTDLSAFSGGGVVQMNGLTTATWLNGLGPILASSVTSSTVVFTDPTSHGTLASHAEVGVIGFSACASGQGINGSHAYNVDHSIFRYLSNMVVTANCHSYHDNLFEFLYGTFASGTQQQHPNVMNCIGGASSENLYWYNNMMRHTFVTENVYFAVRTNIYYFNNVMYDNMNSVFGPKSEASVCTRFNTVANSTLPVNGFIYNNTDGDNSCMVKFEVANAPLTQWSGTGTFENNNYGAQGSNCSGTCGTALTGEYTCSTGGACTVVNNGTHVFQTTATQNAQGYTATGLYRPTLGGSTIGAGTNASASCSTFSPDSALCSGTSAGVTEQSGSGGQVASSPAVTIIPRGTTFDAGAYEFSSAIAPLGAPFFGIDPNSNSSYPSTIGHDCVRIWDTPGATWSAIQSVNTNTFSFANLDNVLALAHNAGVNCAQIALARTPSFATSAPGDTSCSYYTAPGTAPGTSPGQCDPPSDLDHTGIGTNQFFRNWVAGLIAHVNAGCPGSGCYTNTHARLYIYETWNEPEACQFWNTPAGQCAGSGGGTGTGTMNQLARMEVDAYQIAKGLTGTNPFTGETNAQVWASITSVTVTGPLDPTAVILMPSVTPFAFTTEGQQFLYCNFAPVPADCTLGGAPWTDGLNYHLKLGNGAKNGVASTTPEATGTSWNSIIQGTLQTREQGLPFYNTEGGAAVGGFVNCSTATGTAPPYCNYADSDMSASLTSRTYLFQGCEKYTNVVWYNWPAGLSGLAATAYTSTFNWMNGSTGIVCATTAPGTAKAGLNTWTATMTQSGKLQAAVWDNSQDCNAGVCTTTPQTVASTYTAYSDLLGDPPVTIFGHQVPVGVKPVLMQILPTFTITATATGSGTITDSYGQISCPGTCSAVYAQGSMVTFTAHPGLGAAFSAWTGCVSLTSTCTITVSTSASVVGTFISGVPISAPCSACFIASAKENQ